MSTKPSRTSKLIQAAALAAVLVPLGSVAVETSPIPHTYAGSGTASPANNQVFDFGTYELQLFFENLANLAIFEVIVDNQPTNQGAVASRLTGPGLGGNICVPIDPITIPGDPCVDFFITAPGPNGPNNPGPDTWTGFYDVTIRWDFDTDPAFPNTPGNRIRILHNRGDVPGNGFDTDITTPGSYFSGFDPAIGGRDDNFQSLIVTQNGNAVPEPATLFLVTTGVSGLLYRRRRKRQDSAGR